jgi:hypothetical protein
VFAEERIHIMERWVITALAVLVMGAPSSPALADDEDEQRAAQESYEQPLQEVFQTDLVYPQERGEVQITFAPQFAQENQRDLLHYSVGIEYGLTEAGAEMRTPSKVHAAPPPWCGKFCHPHPE